MRVAILLAILVSTVMCDKHHEERFRPKRPHIIFYLVDDMGWNDVGYHNMTQIPTPNIDALASNSIILNNYYTHPACSPSRSALMSGKLATTTGLQHYVIQDLQEVGLPLNLRTLPEHMRSLGYSTEMIGKWHLGFYKKKYTPTYRGFDNHFGFWLGDTDLFYHTTSSIRNRSNLYGIPCYEPRNEIPVQGQTSRRNFEKISNTGTYLTYVYTDEAKRVIRRHNPKKPLFLYYAHHGVHRGNSLLPVRAPEPLVNIFPDIQDDERRNFAGALTAIDMSLGELMVSLEKKKMLDDTIIVFSSDNGSPLPGDLQNGGSNYPLRGAKLTGWEGGVRANSFIWSKNFKYRGVHDGLMHIVDWMPTLYSAAGGKRDIVKQYNLDAKDMWDSIRENSPSPRKNIVLQNDSIYDYKVFRSGDMKLIMGEYPEQGSNEHHGDSGREPPPKDIPNKPSNTEQVLKRFYKKINKEYNDQLTVIEVKCIDLSQQISCVSAPDMVCLYNVTADPCEQRNLAELQPETVTRLKEELSQLNGRSPDYPIGDYASAPIFYEGYWSPWKDRLNNYNSTSC